MTARAMTLTLTGLSAGHEDYMNQEFLTDLIERDDDVCECGLDYVVLEGEKYCPDCGKSE